MIFHPEGEEHADHFHTSARCFNLLLDTRRAEDACGCSVPLDRPAAFDGGYLAQLATKIYKEFRHADELTPLIVKGLMTELLGEAARSTLRDRRPKPPRWLEQTRDILRDRFRDSVTLTEVAESTGVHKTHLCREFRRHYRCTVGEYLRRLRVEFARRQLSHTDAPVGEIALAAGFFDQSHFTKTFRLHAGMTPNEYRALHRPR